MSIKNLLYISIILFSFIKSDIYINRHNGYNAVYDCLGDDKGENDSEGTNTIQSPEDCFDESPYTKYECCYFEYYKNKNWKTGCMKIYKGDDEDLNDLKYYVSKLSSKTVFNCRQCFLNYNFSFGILLAFIIFLI